MDTDSLEALHLIVDDVDSYIDLKFGFPHTNQKGQMAYVISHGRVVREYPANPGQSGDKVIRTLRPLGYIEAAPFDAESGSYRFTVTQKGRSHVAEDKHGR